MSDLLLTPTPEGGEITIIDGDPLTTDGLDNAVYLSLFTAAWWGNSIADADEVYTSVLESLFSRPLTNALRLDIIDEAQRVLEWMVTAGIVARVVIDAEIPGVGVLHLQIRLEQPDGAEVVPVFALNWEAQRVALL